MDPEKLPVDFRMERKELAVDMVDVGMDQVAKNIKQEYQDLEMGLGDEDTDPEGESSLMSHDCKESIGSSSISTENDSTIRCASENGIDYEVHEHGIVDTHDASHMAKLKQEIDIEGEMYICSTEKLADKSNNKREVNQVKKGKSKEVQCSYCDKFISRYHLKKHIRTHTRGPSKCDKCGSEFSTIRKLSFHMKTHDNQSKKYTCNVCEQEFYENRYLQKHMIRHREKPFKCSECPKKFFTSRYLNNHIENIHNNANSIYACDVCGSEFATSEQIRKHMRLHTGDKLNQCEFCHAVFSQPHHLQNHIRQHTGETPFQCDLCGKRFRRNAYLKVHIQTHTGVKPFECDICHIKLSSKWSLRCHLKLHPEYYATISEDKNATVLKYKCDDCGMVFKRNDALKNHKMKEHTGEKPFKCLVCGVGFRKGSHLVNHSRQHTGETPFVCEVCGSKFRRISYLRIHARKHTGERPYECTICKKRFMDPGHLRNHVKSCTEEKRVFQCEFCQKLYTLQAPYKKHLMKCGQKGGLKNHSDFCSCKNGMQARNPDLNTEVQMDEGVSSNSGINEETSNYLQKAAKNEKGDSETVNEVRKLRQHQENVGECDVLVSTDDEGDHVSDKDKNIRNERSEKDFNKEPYSDKDENVRNEVLEKDSNNETNFDNDENVRNELSEKQDSETQHEERSHNKLDKLREIEDPFTCKVCRKPYKL